MALGYYLLIHHPFASQPISMPYYGILNYIKKVLVLGTYPSPNSEYFLHCST